MPCKTCGGGGKSKAAEGPYLVTSKTGETVEVANELAARVQVAKWGGGSYKKKEA